MLALYFDHNVPRAIAISVRDRGVEVLTAYEDDHHQVPDPIFLQRATTLGRPLFTMDDDLLAEAAMLQSQGDDFGGVIYSHQRRVQIGRCVEDLVYIAESVTAEEILNEVIFLPL
jgi:hypothetical protein